MPVDRQQEKTVTLPLIKLQIKQVVKSSKVSGVSLCSHFKTEVFVIEIWSQSRSGLWNESGTTQIKH